MDAASMYPAFEPSMARDTPSMTHTAAIIVSITGNAAIFSRNVYRIEITRAIPVLYVHVCVCVCVRHLTRIQQDRHTHMAPEHLSLHPS